MHAVFHTAQAGLTQAVAEHLSRCAKVHFQDLVVVELTATPGHLDAGLAHAPAVHPELDMAASRDYALPLVLAVRRLIRAEGHSIALACIMEIC